MFGFRKVFLLLFLIFSLPKLVFSASNLDLNQKINEKNKELQAIEKQRREVLMKLSKLGNEKNSLRKEIRVYNYRLNQLSLEIKSEEITISRINLEIKNLNSEISKLDNDIKIKKELLGDLLQKIEEKDKEPFLFIFLKNQSFSQSIDEVQEIMNFDNQLTDQLEDLKNLKKEKNKNLDAISQEKKLEEKTNFNLINKKEILKDQKSSEKLLLSETKNKESLYNIKLKKLEKIRSEVSFEIEKIEKELRKKINPNLLPIPRPGVLLKPLNGILTQGYGYTKFARTHYRSHRHNGIDIAAPFGSPIFAADDGKVIAVGNQDKYCWHGAYGKFIVIQHPNNLTTFYAHLSRQVVSVGDKVKRGQIIGYIGNSGYCFGRNGGVHLHFSVYSSPTFYMGMSHSCGPMPYGGDLNPLNYLKL